jgi:ABC-type nitrate/sulfonate/bicarbonate transport system ATPase subunit
MIKILNLVQLKERIHEAAEQVSGDMPQRVRQEVGYLLDILRATNGAHTRT